MKQHGWICDGCGSTDEGRYGFPYNWFRVRVEIAAPKPNVSYPPEEGIPDRRTVYKGLAFCRIEHLALWVDAKGRGLVKRTVRS